MRQSNESRTEPTENTHGREQNTEQYRTEQNTGRTLTVENRTQGGHSQSRTEHGSVQYRTEPKEDTHGADFLEVAAVGPEVDELLVEEPGELELQRVVVGHVAGQDDALPHSHVQVAGRAGDGRGLWRHKHTPYIRVFSRHLIQRLSR